MMKITRSYRPVKILHFDIENRPLSYWYDGNCTAEITAIAWSWADEEEVTCLTLKNQTNEFYHLEHLGYMLKEFCSVYDEADIVTGHYIRRHDLPIVNGALMELGLPTLSSKLASDTKTDLVRRGGIAASQEALSAMYVLDSDKYKMTQSAWRSANRLYEVWETEIRVIDDVKQHKELRARLIQENVLKPPRVWRP